MSSNSPAHSGAWVYLALNVLLQPEIFLELLLLYQVSFIRTYFDTQSGHHGAQNKPDDIRRGQLIPVPN